MADLILKLTPFMVPQVIALIKAIAALKQTGASEEDIQALIKTLGSDITSLNADTLAVLANIPEPGAAAVATLAPK